MCITCEVYIFIPKNDVQKQLRYSCNYLAPNCCSCGLFLWPSPRAFCDYIVCVCLFVFPYVINESVYSNVCFCVCVCMCVCGGMCVGVYVFAYPCACGCTGACVAVCFLSKYVSSFSVLLHITSSFIRKCHR